MDEGGKTSNENMTWKTLGEGTSTTIVAAFDPSIAGMLMTLYTAQWFFANVLILKIKVAHTLPIVPSLKPRRIMSVTQKVQRNYGS
jgi:hypothetical protein